MMKITKISMVRGADQRAGKLEVVNRNDYGSRAAFLETETLVTKYWKDALIEPDNPKSKTKRRVSKYWLAQCLF